MGRATTPYPSPGACPDCGRPLFYDSSEQVWACIDCIVDLLTEVVAPELARRTATARLPSGRRAQTATYDPRQPERRTKE
jgi:hypothetical protein